MYSWSQDVSDCVLFEIIIKKRKKKKKHKYLTQLHADASVLISNFDSLLLRYIVSLSGGRDSNTLERQITVLPWPLYAFLLSSWHFSSALLLKNKHFEYQHFRWIVSHVYLKGNILYSIGQRKRPDGTTVKCRKTVCLSEQNRHSFFLFRESKRIMC